MSLSLASDDREVVPGIYETYLKGNGIEVLDLHLMGNVCAVFQPF